jgi:NAD+ synthase (glutamine-hydrolysing)
VTKSLRLAGAQLDLIVGDIAGNTEQILAAMKAASRSGADVLLVPELAISGYPPEDLVLRDGFVDANLAALDVIAKQSDDVVTIVGFVDRLAVGRFDDDSVPRRVTNAAAVLANGSVVSIYHKSLLPNYGVFDEARYFAEGRTELELHEIAGIPCGISICEDIWDADGRPTAQARGGARVLLNINGSPFHVGKSNERYELLRDRAVANQTHVVYVNCVGGQDELVFDGGSMVIAPDGDVVHRSPLFVTDQFVVDIEVSDDAQPPTVPVVTVSTSAQPRADERPGSVAAVLSREEEIYRALTCGLAGYVTKNGFSEVVIGLSGGIDSALTAAIAVDALGAESVQGITMPTRYSSDGSVNDSLDLAERLGIRADTIPIDDVFTSFLEAVEPQFKGTVENVAEENLQARIRGTILMAISNKFGSMVVATGNKSEMAVGYATLYGDMAGGYSVLKDVYKTTVYDLARWRNRNDEIIPVAIIEKEPSAELRPDQLDSDSLPPYGILDAILWEYIEADRTARDIIRDGHDAALVNQVAAMVDRNEYKRRQAAPGVKITKKAFGRDRRLPITNRFRP